MMKAYRTKLLLAYYGFIVVYWAFAFASGKTSTPLNYWYQFFFGLIPLCAGLYGFIVTKKVWGGFGSQLGKAIGFLSLGLITWGIGQMIWAFYTIREIAEVPYPSFADLAYIVSWPLWIAGIINLSKATGAKFGLRKGRGKLILFVIPLIAVIASYWLLFLVARGGAIDTGSGLLKLFFDLAYPIGDVIILTVALLVLGLSFDYLGGKFKVAILSILAGFVLNYFTDFVFSYTTTQETYYNGHWVDLLFPTVMTLLGYGILSFDSSRFGNSKSVTEAAIAAAGPVPAASVPAVAPLSPKEESAGTDPVAAMPGNVPTPLQAGPQQDTPVGPAAPASAPAVTPGSVTVSPPMPEQPSAPPVPSQPVASSPSAAQQPVTTVQAPPPALLSEEPEQATASDDTPPATRQGQPQ